VKEDLATVDPYANPLVGYMYYTTRENTGHAIVLFGVESRGYLSILYLEVTVIGGYPFIYTLWDSEKKNTHAIFL
jgi:hypothetical protein